MPLSLDALQAAAPGFTWSAPRGQDLPALKPPALPLSTLRRALKKAHRPVFLVNDATRLQPQAFGFALQELWEEAGQPPILVATGTHGANEARERDRLQGLPLELHDADDFQAHMALNEDLPHVRIDRRVAKADLIVSFGVVEPHYFAGWSGAHKTASVGIWSRDTIQRNHELALQSAARPLALEGNPVFDDLAASLYYLEADGRRLLAVNHVLDHAGRVLGLGAGTWRGSLKRCAPAAAGRYLRELPGQVELLVAEVEGNWARTLYQADKGIKNHEDALRPGGRLILAAPLDQGLGADRFVDFLRAAPDLEAARARIEREGYVLGDHKALRIRALQARGVELRLLSEQLDPAALEGTGLQVCPSLEEACAGAQGQLAAWIDDAALSVSTWPGRESATASR